MKRILIIATLLALTLVKPVHAEEPQIYEVKATSYCYNSGQTATQTVPKEGRTLAGKPDWYGKTVVVWENKGNGIRPENYIGTFICEDTGNEAIKNGYVVDLFIADKQEAIEFGTKNVIIEVIESEG